MTYLDRMRMGTRKLMESLQLFASLTQQLTHFVLSFIVMVIHSPLHLAVLQGFIEVVFSLVRILPDPRLLEIPNKMLQVSVIQLRF